jgi:hypothetical protein
VNAGPQQRIHLLGGAGSIECAIGMELRGDGREDTLPTNFVLENGSPPWIAGPRCCIAK